MKDNNILGLCGIDTRSLTRRIRNLGTMRGIITMERPTEAQLAQMKDFAVIRPVDKVTCREPAMRMGGNENRRSGFRPETQHSAEPGGPRRKAHGISRPYRSSQDFGGRF